MTVNGENVVFMVPFFPGVRQRPKFPRSLRYGSGTSPWPEHLHEVYKTLDLLGSQNFLVTTQAHVPVSSALFSSTDAAEHLPHSTISEGCTAWIGSIDFPTPQCRRRKIGYHRWNLQVWLFIIISYHQLTTRSSAQQRYRRHNGYTGLTSATLVISGSN